MVDIKPTKRTSDIQKADGRIWCVRICSFFQTQNRRLFSPKYTKKELTSANSFLTYVDIINSRTRRKVLPI